MAKVWSWSHSALGLGLLTRFQFSNGVADGLIAKLAIIHFFFQSLMH